MALTTPDIKIYLYLNDEKTALLLADDTGGYSGVSNPLGYNLPGGMTVNSVTSVVIAVNYTLLSTTVTYTLTVLNGVITAATCTIAAGTPANILSELESTTWPFPDAIPFNITTGYGALVPSMDDMVYTVTYTVIGEQDEESYSYPVVDNYLVDLAACYCAQKALVKENIGTDTDKKGSRAIAYLQSANYSTENGDVEEANNFLTLAKSICKDNCGCGCS